MVGSRRVIRGGEKPTGRRTTVEARLVQHRGEAGTRHGGMGFFLVTLLSGGNLDSLLHPGEECTPEARVGL